MAWKIARHGSGVYHLEPAKISSGMKPVVTLLETQGMRGDYPQYNISVGLQIGKTLKPLLHAKSEDLRSREVIIQTQDKGMSNRQHVEALDLVAAKIGSSKKNTEYLTMIAALKAKLTGNK